MPICKTCNDTHRMTVGGEALPCTHCPVPCPNCRQLGDGRIGVYCAKTPCGCPCHAFAQADTTPAPAPPPASLGPLVATLVTAATRHVVRLSYLEAIARKAKVWVDAPADDPDVKARRAADLEAEVVRARAEGML